MTVKELIEKLQEFPEDASVSWNGFFITPKLEIFNRVCTGDRKFQELQIFYEQTHDSCDYYDECPDCGKDLN